MDGRCRCLILASMHAYKRSALNRTWTRIRCCQYCKVLLVLIRGKNSDDSRSFVQCTSHSHGDETPLNLRSANPLAFHPGKSTTTDGGHSFEVQGDVTVNANEPSKVNME